MQIAKPMNINNNVRKINSVRSSQGGIRSGAGCTISNAGKTASACPGWVAGLAGNEGEIDSGSWDILGLRAPPLSRRFAGIGRRPGNPGPAQGRRIATVTQPPP